MSSIHPALPSEKRDAASLLSLSTLPSSFTTLLLSLIDSPAYACLTTSYLNDIFNPSTPDDTRVKYFSVASRIDEMNIWHPLWLPKMVLDDAEKKARDLTASTREDEWGNDGLVTVQSARWGKFLGIVDGCDHWEIRGARGLELNVDLPPGIGSITEGWALGDWSRFIGAWRKQERSTSGELELAQATGETEQITQDGRNDLVVKASTDKLSAVFDWIVEHNASPLKEALPSNKTNENEMATKFDLERFYLALARELYDQGL